jgi:hypothetical protein
MRLRENHNNLSNVVTLSSITFFLPDVDEPNNPIFADLQAAASSPSTAAQVRSVLIITNHYPEEHEHEYGDGTSRSNVLTPRMRQALQLLADFPSLERIHIHFARYCNNQGPSTALYYDDRDNTPSDSVEYRRDVLSTVFDVIAAGRLQGIALTLTNLQNYSDPQLVSRPAFQNVLRRCAELNLVVAESLSSNLRREWWSSFPNTWLAPIQSTVARLSIRSHRYQSYRGPWGFFPKCDLRGLRFENLESLTLGSWVVTHRWQVDWLLAQPALAHLTLDNCVIPRYVEQRRPLDDEFYPRYDGLGSDWCPPWEPRTLWLPRLTWADVFTALKQSPTLRTIRSGHFDSPYGDLLPTARAVWTPDPDSGRKRSRILRFLIYEGGYCAFRDGYWFQQLKGSSSWWGTRKRRTFKDAEKTSRPLAEILQERMAVAQGEPPYTEEIWSEYKWKHEPRDDELWYVDWEAVEQADAAQETTVHDMRALRELEGELALRHIEAHISDIGYPAGEGPEL